jgi:hypothetical protein
VYLTATVAVGVAEIVWDLHPAGTFPWDKEDNVNDLRNALVISTRLAQGVAKRNDTGPNLFRFRQATFGVCTGVAADRPSQSNTVQLCHTLAAKAAISARATDTAHTAYLTKAFASC